GWPEAVLPPLPCCSPEALLPLPCWPEASLPALPWPPPLLPLPCWPEALLPPLPCAAEPLESGSATATAPPTPPISRPAVSTHTPVAKRKCDRPAIWSLPAKGPRASNRSAYLSRGITHAQRSPNPGVAKDQ